jgi:hypothetical protein
MTKAAIEKLIDSYLWMYQDAVEAGGDVFADYCMRKADALAGLLYAPKT